MEINNTHLNLQEITEDMVKVLGNEVTGYQLGSAEICNVYCRPVLGYAPAVVITAQKGEDVRYLIYSPLSAQMLVTDKKPLEEASVGECSVNGCLSATVVEKDGRKTIFLNFKEEDTVCFTQEKAINKMTGWLAVTYERKLRLAYYLNAPANRIPTPQMVLGFLCWGITLERKKNWKLSLLVYVGSSHVFSFGADKMHYKSIDAADVYWTAEKGVSTRKFNWNGISFVPNLKKNSCIACSNAAV